MGRKDGKENGIEDKRDRSQSEVYVAMRDPEHCGAPATPQQYVVY